AYCLRHTQERGLARLTVYGEFLHKHPPLWEAEIWENTAWSCSHGVDRWRADCGCRSGGNDWHQKWRAPVREAMDWLAAELALIYEREMGRLVRDPWQARDAYIEVILDRSPARVREFFHRHSGREFSPQESVQALRLLEMQRQAMLMFTSCGWFFDEVSGIESTQTLAYAGRAMQLAQVAAGIDLEPDYLRRLEKAPSNLPGWGDAARVFETAVKPGRIDLLRVGAHQAIASLFQEAGDERRIYCYTTGQREAEHLRAGMIQLSLGHTRVRSEITWAEADFTYAVVHLGGQNVSAGIGPAAAAGAFEEMRAAFRELSADSDIPGLVRLLDSCFDHQYTLRHLFRDEQRKVVRHVMAPTLKELETTFRSIYSNQFTLVRFLHTIAMPVPPELARPVEIALKGEMRRLLQAELPQLEEVRRLAGEMRQVGVTIEQSGLARLAGSRLQGALERLSRDPDDLPLLIWLGEFLDLFRELPLDIELWQAQNSYFALWRPSLARLSATTLDPFLELGRKLRIKVD
ncbi:MAG: DUF3536 domain-containing protein, partial [Desulfuromonadales bacterium]|nr:DUF3536 domain-containing protein [Desulfuromonadales bacterium]